MFGFVYVVVLLLRTRIFSNTCEILGRVFAIIMTALSFLELLRKCFSFNRASRSHAKTGLFLALFGNFFLCGFWGCLLWSPVTVLVPKVSPMGLQNNTKIIKNASRRRLFPKTAHMRSAHACAVQTLFPARLYDPLSANMLSGRPSKKTHKKGIQNNSQFVKNVPKVSQLGSQMGSKITLKSSL